MRWHNKFWPALITPSPAITNLFPVNAFPILLGANVHNNLRNPPFYYFTSFLIVSLTSCFSIPYYSGDLVIFIISSISSFKIINVVVPDP